MVICAAFSRSGLGVQLKPQPDPDEESPKTWRAPTAADPTFLRASLGINRGPRSPAPALDTSSRCVAVLRANGPERTGLESGFGRIKIPSPASDQLTLRCPSRGPLSGFICCMFLCPLRPSPSALSLPEKQIATRAEEHGDSRRKPADDLHDHVHLQGSLHAPDVSRIVVLGDLSALVTLNFAQELSYRSIELRL